MTTTETTSPAADAKAGEKPAKKKDVRLAALRRFALAITVLNILGHTVLGFEQAWRVPVAALLTAYAMELGLEWLDARLNGRTPRFAGGRVKFVDFLLPGHITALAVGMLLYSGSRLLPVIFGVVVALASKAILRVRIGGGDRHVLNPSNTGIAVALVLFPWVGISPPYHFTENVTGFWDWLLPGIIVASGTFLNGKLTKRLPLIGAWLAGFAAQGVLRVLLFDAPLAGVLLPMTGLAFVLFTNYMITDPATTPSRARNQVFFGASVAALYGILTSVHIVFGMFFALVMVCAVRGIYLYAASRRIGLPASAAPAAPRSELAHPDLAAARVVPA